MCRRCRPRAEPRPPSPRPRTSNPLHEIGAQCSAGWRSESTAALFRRETGQSPRDWLLTWRRRRVERHPVDRQHMRGDMSYPSAAPRSHQIDVVDQVGRAYRVVLDNLQLVGEMALLPYLIVLGI